MRYLSCAGEGNWGSSLKSDSNRNFVTSRSPNTFWKQEAANRRLKEISLPNALGIADSNRFHFEPMPELSIFIDFSSSPWQMIMFLKKKKRKEILSFPDEDQNDRFCYTLWGRCDGGNNTGYKQILLHLWGRCDGSRRKQYWLQTDSATTVRAVWRRETILVTNRFCYTCEGGVTEENNTGYKQILLQQWGRLTEETILITNRFCYNSEGGCDGGNNTGNRTVNIDTGHKPNIRRCRLFAETRVVWKSIDKTEKTTTKNNNKKTTTKNNHNPQITNQRQSVRAKGNLKTSAILTIRDLRHFLLFAVWSSGFRSTGWRGKGE